MISRVPQALLGLVREKSHSVFAMPRKDKSLGDTDLFSYLSGFFLYRKDDVYEQALVDRFTSCFL